MVEQSNINLDVAVKVHALREKMQLTQREFASLISKPQSTITRIENTSTKMLSKIAKATNQRLSIQFNPLLYS